MGVLWFSTWLWVQTCSRYELWPGLALELVTCTRVTSISIPLGLVLCHLVLKGDRLFGVASFWGIPASDATGPCDAPAQFLPLHLNLEYGSCLLSESSLTGVGAEPPEERPTGNKQKLSLHRIFHHLRFLQGKRKRWEGKFPPLWRQITPAVFYSVLFPINSLHPFGSLPSWGKWLAWVRQEKAGDTVYLSHSSPPWISGPCCFHRRTR